MIKNIVFDLGNVLLDFRPLDYTFSKVPDKEKALQVYEQIFRSKEWLMLDRGVISEEEAINVLCDRNPDNSAFIRLVMDRWYQLLTPINEHVEILTELSNNGYNVFYLSNFHLMAAEDVNKRFEFFKVFKGGIYSYKEKLLKPEKDIYNRLVETYGINPTESIFIDDTWENVESAMQLGFHIIHLTDNVKMREELAKYNLL